MVILGIDPGTATTGYGLIEVPSPPHPSSPSRGEETKEGVRLLEYGCILTDKKLPAPARLLEIHRDLTKLIKKYRPQILAVESVFFYSNVKTAISVAQARGIVLLCGQQHKLVLKEFTPLQIKNSLTGYGKADKKQVQYMVKQLLKLKTYPKPDDAADALAVAICAAGKSV